MTSQALDVPLVCSVHIPCGHFNYESAQIFVLFISHHPLWMGEARVRPVTVAAAFGLVAVASTITWSFGSLELADYWLKLQFCSHLARCNDHEAQEESVPHLVQLQVSTLGRSYKNKITYG